MKTGAVMMCLWMATPLLWAQTKSGDGRKTLNEAAKVLQDARSNNDKDNTRLAEKPLKASILDKLVSQGERDADDKPSPAELKAAEDSNKKLMQAVGRATSQGAPLVAQQSNTVPALKTPTPVGAPAAAKGAAPASGVATTKDANLAAAPKGPSKIVITAEGAGYFDSKTSMGVFTEDVIMDHPQFHMNCDELEIYMKKAAAKPKAIAPALDENGKPIPSAKPATEPPPESEEEGSLEKAIAKGRRVVINKLTENGEPQVGVCRHATYIGIATSIYEVGDVILRDMPQVQRGRSLIRATTPSTYMIIKQEGQLKTFGPSTTEIIQQPDKKAPAAGAAGATPPTAGTAPAPATKATAPKTKAGS
jgi:hypothetical protein